MLLPLFSSRTAFITVAASMTLDTRGLTMSSRTIGSSGSSGRSSLCISCRRS